MPPALYRIFALAFALALANQAIADETPLPDIDGLMRAGVGVTRDDTPFFAYVPRENSAAAGSKLRILLVGGVEARSSTRQAIIDALRWFQELKKSGDLAFDPTQFSLAGLPAPGPATGHSYPPTEGYHSPTKSNQAYLWNWIGMHAPDLVVVVNVATEPKLAGDIYIPKNCEALDPLRKSIQPALRLFSDDDLVAQLASGRPAGMGSIPAIGITVEEGKSAKEVERVLKLLAAAKYSGPSPARAELVRRQSRSAKQVISDLLPHYGQNLNEVAYIPIMPLLARLDLAEQSGDASYREHVEKVAADFLSGKKTQAIKSGSEMAGYLLFSELAKRAEGDKKTAVIRLVRSAADLCFDDKGQPREIAPFHNEMSDAVFMSGPILAAAGRLTGEPKYYEACLRHTENMLKLVVRDDGLCRHSPLCEAAWGRGNGFAALGLALTLDDFPVDHPGRARLEVASCRHLRALLKHQDPDGSWHQVVDEPGSYRELSATCMITFAMLRGIRAGRLSKEEFQPTIDRAWLAILARVGPNGQLVDVCTGTGKQKTLRDYYDRPAIFGPDPRGGGMALLVAVEKGRQSSKDSAAPP